MAELVGPLDRALRTTRVLIRRIAVAARLAETMPPDYLAVLDDLAEVTRDIAPELAANRTGRLPCSRGWSRSASARRRHRSR